MIPGLEDLYQEVILDHARHPRLRGLLEGPRAHGHNPLCGDQVTVSVLVEGGVLRDLRCEGQGCAISTASASLMAERVKGLDLAAVEALTERVIGLATGRSEPDPDLGKLQALGGVARFPMRVKCATLPWHVLRAALRGEAEVEPSE